jgi:hypothetical protein
LFSDFVVGFGFLPKYTFDILLDSVFLVEVIGLKFRNGLEDDLEEDLDLGVHHFY